MNQEDNEREERKDIEEEFEDDLETKMRRMRMTVAGVVILAIVIAVAYQLTRPLRVATTTSYVAPYEEQQKVIKALTSDKSLRIYGGKHAEIVIHAIFPFDSECHDRTVAMARAFAERYPDHVRLELYNMNAPIGDKMMKKYKTSCAHMYVNGVSRFKIMRGSRMVQVELTGPENNIYYVTDVYRILAGLLKQKWPDCPEPPLPKKVYDDVLSGKYPGLEIKKNIPKVETSGAGNEAPKADARN